jgi:hypothetical protein
MKTAIASTALLVLLLQVGAGQTAKPPNAKPKRQAKEKPQPKEQSGIYSSALFDSRASTLPVGYRGHDAKRIYEAVKERLASKGEFETTKAYQDRINSVPSLPLVGNLTLSNLFAFDLDRPTYEYDADKGSLHIGAKFGSVYKGSTPSDLHRGLKLRGGDILEETYEATNALGARVRVRKTDMVAYELAVENWGDWQAKDGGILDSLNLDPAKAQRLKPSFRLLAVCRLKPPYFGFERIMSTKPTFESPSETQIVSRYLYADLVELWAYDLASGQVLYKRQK